MLNETYWKDFYSHGHTLKPSPFACWVRPQIVHKRTIDLGCGNGRDTYHLAQYNDVTGVDLYAPDEDMFHRGTIEDYLAHCVHADVIYCRFLFHAIEEKLQWSILHWVRRTGATLYAEMRSVQDHPNHDHQRRLIDGQKLLSDLLEAKFSIIHYQEGHGLAVYKNEDPHVIRVVAKGSGK